MTRGGIGNAGHNKGGVAAMSENTSDKDQAMELAEESRQADWDQPSFTAELFRGSFRWDLMHPFPEQDAKDKEVGDAYLEKVKEVLENVIDPIEVERRGEYPKEFVKAWGDIGAFGMKVGKKYGGLGFSMTNYARILQYVGAYCQSSVTWLSAHQSIGVPEPLKVFGTEEQKQKYLPRFAKGEVSAFALTEPNVGSDPAKVECTAMPSEDGSYYLLNGEKLWITNGPDASVIVVMAKTPPKIVRGKERAQISAFIVEMDSPGCSVKHRCQFMGIKGISNGLLSFDNVKVPAENLIGKTGEGLKIALTTLNTGRMGIPAATLGVAKCMLTHTKKWITERVQWGVPVGKHQLIAQMVSDLAANTFAMEGIVWLCTGFIDHGQADVRLEAAIAKYFCTERAWKPIDNYMQVLGGRGYETEESLYNRGDNPVPCERILRDARVGRIFEGSSQVMHLIMAREALDTHFKLVMPILMPKPGQKQGKLSLIMNAAKFYVPWIPRMYMPGGPSYNVKKLNGSNRSHLAYINSTCKKMARRLLWTMARFGPKMEFEQVLLSNFVEIGVDLFAMTASLALAEKRLSENPDDSSPQELADLFCKDARDRIEAQFRAVKKNHNRDFKKVTKSLMESKLDWLMAGYHKTLPPSFRKQKADAVAEDTAAEGDRVPAK